MNQTIMNHIQCSKCLIRMNILILFALTVSAAMLQPYALNDSTQHIQHTKKMSAFNNNIYHHRNNNNNNNNRFSSIREILYHRPSNLRANETLRWHKINMISNLFKHRVKRRVKPTLAKPLAPSSGQIASKAIIYERNSSTNIIDFSYNKQIHEILTFVNLNMLLNQRSIPIHNVSDILALNISHNVIKQIDVTNILKALEHVRRLDLSHNQITSFNVSVAANKIEWLSISENQLHTFNGTNLVNLKYLDLSCNNIEHTSQMQISELSALEYMNLAGNRLNRIPLHIFEKLIKLKVINLSYNRIDTTNNDMFRSLMNIEALDLSHNQITFVESASFSHLSKLQYLDLSHNFIDAVSLHAFPDISNLIELSIAFNTQLGDALQGFISSWSLKDLDMSGTGLCEIPNALTQSVRTLNISNNNFAVIRCGDLDSYPLLQHVDISSCQISDIEDDALGRLDMLVSLHLNNNNIARVPSSLPVNLVHLFLHNNRIAEIQSSTFLHLVNLEVVNLSGNQLTYLPSLPLPRLMILDVRSSGLRRLSQSIIKMSPKLKVVYLDGNPIKCNELLGVAEWATPCRTDDFIEGGNFDAEKSAMNNDNENKIDVEIWPHCRCRRCETSHVDLNRLQCSSKNVTNFIRAKPVAASLSNAEHLIVGDSTNKTNSLANVEALTEMSETVSNGQQSKRMNNSNLHVNPNIQSIHTKKSGEFTINMSKHSKPSDNLYASNLMTERGAKVQQSGNIITNDIQNANPDPNPNSFDVEMNSMESDTKFSSKINARSVELNETRPMIEPTTATLAVTKAIRKNNLTKSTMDKLANKKSDKIETVKHKEVLHHSQSRIRFDYQISSDEMSRQRNHQNEQQDYETNQISISSNKFEIATAITVSATIGQTTTVTSAIDGHNIPINFEQKHFNQHPKYMDDDHKEKKSEVNWNINKAISTTNDNLQRDRNLVISTFHEGGDNALDTIRLNEINKNQLADKNQLNVSHTPNVTVARENFDSIPTKYTLIKKMTASLAETENKSSNSTSSRYEHFALNERIINSNSLTDTADGMVINGQQSNAKRQNETVSFVRGKIASKSEQMPNGIPLATNPTIEHKESTNIDTTEMSTISLFRSKTNQRLNNHTDTVTNSSVKPHSLESKSLVVEIQREIDNAKVDDNVSKRHKNEQMQQIKTTGRLTTEISKKENPLIGSISQNVSIIDNEHQFERHINIDHSLLRQNTVERTTNANNSSIGSSSAINTKLQSANEHVQAYTQDRYDNSDGSSDGSSDVSGVSDTSAIYGVSEQWNDKRVTSGHSGLFVVIGIGIGVFVTLNLVHLYRYKMRYNSRRNETTEQNRQAQNLLIGMQMEMFNSIHYTDTPIDLW